MPPAEKVHRLQVGEAWRPDLAPVGTVGPVRDEKYAELALRSLDSDIDLAGGNVEALGVQLEVMDQRLHRTFHLATPRRRDLVVLQDYRAPAVGRLQVL